MRRASSTNIATPNVPRRLRASVSSPAGARVIDLGHRAVFTIGRGPDCDIPIDDLSVSRHHAVLFLEPLAVEDLGSRNGTRAGGMLVPSNDRVTLRLGEVIEIGSARLTIHEVTIPPERIESTETLIAHDEPSRDAYDTLVAAIDAGAHPLVQGSIGVGKLHFARIAKLQSVRAGGPFLEIGCGDLPPAILEHELFGYERNLMPHAREAKAGLLERATGGVLVLENVTTLTPETQEKLALALESGFVVREGGRIARRIDVRVIGTTLEDPPELVPALAHVLGTTIVRLGKLADRRADVLPIAEHFLKRAKPAMTFSQSAVGAILRYDWPGNIDEMETVISRAVRRAEGNEIDDTDLLLDVADESLDRQSMPAFLFAPTLAPPSPDFRGETTIDVPLSPELRVLEKERIISALSESAWSEERAAKRLGIAKAHLRGRLEAHGVSIPGQQARRTRA